MREYLMLALLALVAISSGVDLVTDIGYGVDRWHVAKEALLALLALALVGWIWGGLRRQAGDLKRLRAELEAGRRAAADNPARERLGELIRDQFAAWALTPSEAEIGLLLLKGLSTREIAALRQTTEKTVRQQASAVYRKAGVPGRHAFAAWFIEDFL